MKKRKLSLVVTSLLLGLLLGMAGCGNKATASISGSGADTVTSGDEQVIRIAYLPITHALPVFETKELAEDYRVELVKYGSWAELMDALNAGQVDGASVLMELAMKAYEQGVNLKAAALGHRDGNVIVVSKDIDFMEDLKGKSFAIPHRQSSHNILMQDALAKNGMTTEDINVVELSPTEMPSALASGQIDGYCVAEPFGAMAVALKVGKVLYESDELWEDSICCGLVLTGDFIENQPKLAQEFVTDYKEAGEQLDETEAETIAENYLGQGETILKTSLPWIDYSDLTITEKDYDTLVQKMTEDELLENPPSYEDFVVDFQEK